MSLEAIIRQRIEKDGPITVADYMSLALSHPEHGYYMKKDPLGKEGDFVTAPEVSQIFGELIGAWLAEQWIIMERPKAALVELGPGRGTLMADILRGTKHVQGFHDAISVHMVETSPALKQKQWQKLANAHHDIEWHTAIESLPEKPWLVIANEFFDALPVRQLLHDQGGWHERVIAVGKEGKLQFSLKPIKKPPESFVGAGIVDDTIYEHSEATQTMVGEISEHIVTHGGVGLIVDYGYSFTSSKNQKSGGDTLQAVRAHGYRDVLEDPGGADLTCHVDFVSLKHTAIMHGAITHGPITQGVFLRNLGAIIRAVKLCENANPRQKSVVIAGLERLMSVDGGMGDLFKVLTITSPEHPRPEGF